MLRMDLNEIKGKIQMYPENWQNLKETNCYAYALGLDISENKICNFAYQPGMISETLNLPNMDHFSYQNLVKGVESDLEYLGLSYREIDPKDDIQLDEWKIALMIENCNDDSEDELDNFHFLRTNKNNNWVHKCSYLDPISKKDNLQQTIEDPRECELSPYQYKKCYALKINK